MIPKLTIKLLSVFLFQVLTLVSYPLLADRLKDLTSIAGVRSNQLVGYGIVVGLAGTGDGNIGLTLQSMQSMVSRFGLATDVKGLDGKNTAAVMVTGELGAFGKPGQNINVTVSTLGKRGMEVRKWNPSLAVFIAAANLCSRHTSYDMLVQC